MFSTQKEFIHTSEAVMDGHPDKICDRISDEIVDAYLSIDPYARVSVDAVVTKNFVALVGEVSARETLSKNQIERIVRETIKDIGYDQDGFHWRQVDIINRIHQQSQEAGQATTQDGSSDQCVVTGYATNESQSLMPIGLHYTQRLMEALSYARRIKAIPDLLPDGKCQIGILYRNMKPAGLAHLTLSLQHKPSISPTLLQDRIIPIINRVFPSYWLPLRPECLFFNTNGPFTQGGPAADSGCTGRKIVADNYGGVIPHGGGAFSGKDPSKIDRSGAYMARYIAKNVVLSGLADRCMIQLSYAMGQKEYLSLNMETFGTGIVDDGILTSTLLNTISLNPRQIREQLGLHRPIYATTAQFGHFGRTIETGPFFPWEKDDLSHKLRDAFNLAAAC